MSFRHKPHRNLLIQAPIKDELYHDEPDSPNPSKQNEQFLQLQREADYHPPNIFKTPRRIEKLKGKKKRGKHEDKSYSQDEEELLDGSSQYHPDSYEDQEFSFGDENGGYASKSHKLQSDVQRQLSLEIRRHQNDFGEQKIKQMALQIGVPFQQVQRQVRNYLRKKGSMNDSRGDQTIYKKTEMFDDAIRKVLKTTPYSCINKLRTQIEQKLNLYLAKQTLIRRLKNLSYNYQKFQIQKPELKTPSANIQKHAYLNISKELAKQSRMVYFGVIHMALDECKGSMWMKLKPNGEVDHILNEEDVVHIVLILSREKIQFYKVYDGFYNEENHINAIELWLEKTEKDREVVARGTRSDIWLTLEMNLIHFYSNEPIASELLEQHRIQVLPFPQYSPSLNPAEVIFKQIKYQTKARVKSMDIQELKDCIELVVNNHVSYEDIGFTFQKVEESIRRI